MFYKDRKVLVAGGTGFVGTNFVRALLEEGAKVRINVHQRPPAVTDPRLEVVQADFNNLEDCRRACRGMELVFNCAGAVSAARMTVTNPMSAIATNLVVNVRLLEAAMMENVGRILVFSSGTTAYPAVDHAVREDEMWTADPAPVYFGYGWMRRYVELLAQFVGQKSGTQVAICRPTAVYGRDDDFDPKTSHVIPALIRRAVEKEDPYIVWGTGDEVRDFLHVTDLARGCLLLLEKHAVRDPVNIGYGSGVTVRNVVRTVLDEAGHSRAKVVFDASKPTTIPVRLVDTRKAMELLGFSPSVKLDDGLRDTVRWYLEHRG